MLKNSLNDNKRNIKRQIFLYRMEKCRINSFDGQQHITID